QGQKYVDRPRPRWPFAHSRHAGSGQSGGGKVLIRQSLPWAPSLDTSSSLGGTRRGQRDTLLWVQSTPQRVQGVTGVRSRHLGLGHYVEGMKRPRVHMEFGRHTLPYQPVGVLEVLLQEEVEGADAAVGGRQAREALGA